QSALDPAGGEADRIHLLSVVLIALCTVIFIGVGILAALALYGGEGWRRRLSGERLVIGLGLIFPLATLGALLFLSVGVMGMAGTAPADGGLRIEVSGERWWWRITYVTPDGERIES